MARHPRLVFPGVALHINQRGNNRQPCFRQDGDYLTYLGYLRYLAGKYECDVHAYCLMTNHVHLLLTPGEIDAGALLMRDLGRCYVRYFNRRYERTGTLWEGRFKSCAVESERYVLACYRYIELNPVRAGMVAHPSAYPWSSYAANAGFRDEPFVKENEVFRALASDRAARQTAYRALCEESIDPDSLKALRAATSGGYPLVSEAFKSGLELPAGSRIERGKPGPRGMRLRRQSQKLRP